MPGVTFLDIVYRVLGQRGLDVAAAELRTIVFPEAIVTTEGRDREIRLTIGLADGAGHPVLGQSRWVEDGAPAGPWHENFRATLVFAAGDGADAGDLSGAGDGVGDGAVLPADPVGRVLRERAMADMYAHTRSRQIVHGGAMQCAGPLRIGESGLLAELQLVEPDASDQAAFHLHPAKLDAATIVAYGQTDIAIGEPFIPMFIERFRAPRPLGGSFTVHVPSIETLSASGELFDSTFDLYDEQGRLAAQFTRLTCKRIREAGLIRKLTAGPGDGAVNVVAPVSAPEPAVPASVPPSSGAEQYAGWLLDQVGRRLGQPAGAVDDRAGF
jgi:hypothetical protein